MFSVIICVISCVFGALLVPLFHPNPSEVMDVSYIRIKRTSNRIANTQPKLQTKFPQTGHYKHMGISEGYVSDRRDVSYSLRWNRTHVAGMSVSYLLAKNFLSNEHDGLGWWEMFLWYGRGMRRRHKKKYNLYMLLGSNNQSLKVLSTMVAPNLINHNLFSAIEPRVDWLVGKESIGDCANNPWPRYFCNNIVIHKGGACHTHGWCMHRFQLEDGPAFCRSITLQIGAASRYFSKASRSEGDVNLL